MLQIFQGDPRDWYGRDWQWQGDWNAFIVLLLLCWALAGLFIGAVSSFIGWGLLSDICIDSAIACVLLAMVFGYLRSRSVHFTIG